MSQHIRNLSLKDIILRYINSDVLPFHALSFYLLAISLSFPLLIFSFPYYSSPLMNCLWTRALFLASDKKRTHHLRSTCPVGGRAAVDRDICDVNGRWAAQISGREVPFDVVRPAYRLGHRFGFLLSFSFSSSGAAPTLLSPPHTIRHFVYCSLCTNEGAARPCLLVPSTTQRATETRICRRKQKQNGLGR